MRSVMVVCYTVGAGVLVGRHVRRKMKSIFYVCNAKSVFLVDVVLGK